MASMDFLLDQSGTKHPEDMVRAITDGDGKFKLRLRKWVKYSLIADTKRQVFDSTEHYIWAIAVNGNSSDEIVLNNYNTLCCE